MALEPFQLVYLAIEPAAVDEMTMLRVIRQHMDRCLMDNEHLLRVVLYPSIRDNSDIDNGTKIAYAGTAYYSQPPANMTDSDMLASEYRCFLGDNERSYVQSLQMTGWSSLSSVNLMTAEGMLVIDNGVSMIVPNRTIGDDEEDDDLVATDDMMDEEMSHTMYLMAVLIPLSIAAVIAVVSAILYARHHVVFRRIKGEPHPVWSMRPGTAELRQQAVAMELYRDIENASQSSGTHAGSSEPSSARPALADESERS